MNQRFFVIHVNLSFTKDIVMLVISEISDNVKKIQLIELFVLEKLK